MGQWALGMGHGAWGIGHWLEFTCQSLYIHNTCVNVVVISPDGQKIISASDDTTMQLWLGNWQAWLKAACDKVHDNPIFTNPQTEEAKAACEVCRKYVWSKERG